MIPRNRGRRATGLARRPARASENNDRAGKAAFGQGPTRSGRTTPARALTHRSGRHSPRHTYVMTIDLTVVKNALEELTDIELQALATATDEAPQIAPGLIAWIDGACHWEMNRRTGRDYGLQPPEAATDPSEDAASINAVDAMRESFASSGFAPAALKFFDALLKLLSGGRKH